ncbi:MAG: hypothetical protein ONB11_11220, partial [candidate division KSB1 bacterium]|nr:hypothetical protein [candidate division KSB1 bacterium]
HALSNALLEREILDGSEIDEILKKVDEERLNQQATTKIDSAPSAGSRPAAAKPRTSRKRKSAVNDAQQ